MKRIYTRTGDQGTTRIRSGVAVSKDDIIIETNGTLDELNATLGIVVALLPKGHPWADELTQVQQELLVVMSHIATPEGKENPKPLHAEERTQAMELFIDALLSQHGAPRGFVIPGGSLAAAQLHFARTVARRAERRLTTLHRSHPVSPAIAAFVNRLSDLLFVMAENLSNA